MRVVWLRPAVPSVMMGFFKEALLEAEDLGHRWIGGDQAVCEDCVADQDLKTFIREHLGAEDCSTRCTYCGRTENAEIAIPVDLLLREIREALLTEYQAADPSLFDNEDGEWMIPTFDTEGLFQNELDEFPFDSDALAADVIGSFTIDPWSERDPLWLDPGEALVVGWQAFSQQVQHVTRYLFFAQEDLPYDDGVPPGEILTRLGALVNEHNLVTDLGGGTRLFRARHTTVDLPPLTTAEELGAPTADQAKTSSRMSAAGIPVFYGALEQDTAIEETRAHVAEGHPAGEIQVSWGSFETRDLMRVLDLGRVPDVPGLFSPDRTQRPALGFLHTFASEVAKPIPIDGSEHTSYAPTQVVAEYFRHAYRTPAGERLDGILYPSSVRDGGTSCVLFLGAENCCLLEGGWMGVQDHRLALDPASLGSSRFQARREPAISREDGS
jgi:hypothetical protein